MKKTNGATAADLINEIARLYKLRVRIEAENLGVKNAYRALLSTLYIKDGGTQLSLAEKTGMKAPTISITLRKMEKEGLVDRIVDESDLRKTHVYLTEKGKKTTEKLNEGIETVNKLLIGSLKGEDAAAFLKALEGARDGLKN
ncbi:MAG: MarR family transcriptional regulator [Clostridia bacterium]|nr:MarR family transcriptional regulator [Clostridia bacterium]